MAKRHREGVVRATLTMKTHEETLREVQRAPFVGLCRSFQDSRTDNGTPLLCGTHGNSSVPLLRRCLRKNQFGRAKPLETVRNQNVKQYVSTTVDDSVSVRIPLIFSLVFIRYTSGDIYLYFSPQILSPQIYFYCVI